MLPPSPATESPRPSTCHGCSPKRRRPRVAAAAWLPFVSLGEQLETVWASGRPLELRGERQTVRVAPSRVEGCGLLPRRAFQVRYHSAGCHASAFVLRFIGNASRLCSLRCDGAPIAADLHPDLAAGRAGWPAERLLFAGLPSRWSRSEAAPDPPSPSSIPRHPRRLRRGMREPSRPGAVFTAGFHCHARAVRLLAEPRHPGGHCNGMPSAGPIGRDFVGLTLRRPTRQVPSWPPQPAHRFAWRTCHTRRILCRSSGRSSAL